MPSFFLVCDKRMIEIDDEIADYYDEEVGKVIDNQENARIDDEISDS